MYNKVRLKKKGINYSVSTLLLVRTIPKEKLYPHKTHCAFLTTRKHKQMLRLSIIPYITRFVYHIPCIYHLRILSSKVSITRQRYFTTHLHIINITKRILTDDMFVTIYQYMSMSQRKIYQFCLLRGSLIKYLLNRFVYFVYLRKYFLQEEVERVRAK